MAFTEKDMQAQEEQLSALKEELSASTRNLMRSSRAWGSRKTISSSRRR